MKYSPPGSFASCKAQNDINGRTHTGVYRDAQPNDNIVMAFAENKAWNPSNSANASSHRRL